MKSVKIKLKVKTQSDENLPDWGLGKGILVEQEVTLMEDITEENKHRLLMRLDEIYRDLLSKNIEKIIEF